MKRKGTNSKKARELRASWEKLKNAHTTSFSGSKSVAPAVVSLPKLDPRRSAVPSLDTGAGDTSLKETNVYTGNKMLGIGGLHKSNAVPVFSKDDAEDLAKMRRG